jgi:hypothetical protein
MKLLESLLVCIYWTVKEQVIVGNVLINQTWILSLVRCSSEIFLQCILYEQYFRTQDNNIILTVDLAIVADWHMSWMFEITTSLIASIMQKAEKYNFAFQILIKNNILVDLCSFRYMLI